MIRCTRCEERNPDDFTHCRRCAHFLRLTLAKPSWGEALEARRTSTIRCVRCDAETPERFVFCVACGRSPRDRTAEGERQCGACDRWNDAAARFCLFCGEPVLGSRALWEGERCDACWSAVMRGDERFCGGCGHHLSMTRRMLRGILREIRQRHVSAAYRDASALPELHPARAELVIHGDASLWIGLEGSEKGAASLRIALGGEAPSDAALHSLGHWLRSRLDPALRDRDARFRAALEASLREGERLVSASVDRAGASASWLFAEPPNAARVLFWSERVAEAAA